MIVPFPFCFADLIDPIKDELSASDYSEEEDPLLYISQKTGRGPMKEAWLEDYQGVNHPSAVMCAYKLIKVEFRYWGMQVRPSMLWSFSLFCLHF